MGPCHHTTPSFPGPSPQILIPPTSSLTSPIHGNHCLIPAQAAASLRVLWGLPQPRRDFGHLMTTPLSPLAPAIFLLPFPSSPYHRPTLPPLKRFPEPPPALFFLSLSLGMGDRIFLGPSAPLSSCQSLTPCLSACAPSSKQASVPGWGSRVFMNLKNCFSASKAKCEPILLGFIVSCFPGWGVGSSRAPSLSCCAESSRLLGGPLSKRCSTTEAPSFTQSPGVLHPQLARDGKWGVECLGLASSFSLN